MRHWFDGNPVPAPESIVQRNIFPADAGGKDSAGELSDLHYFIGRAEFVRFHPRRAKMAWKAPKIVEVPVGMEINMYACAARK